MICDMEGRNTLHSPIHKKYVKVAVDLVERVPLVGHVNTKDSMVNTPLHYAVQTGDRDLIMRLRRRRGSHEIPNEMVKRHWT